MQRNTIGHQNQPDGSPPPGHGGASALHSDPCCRGGARGAPPLLVHRVHQSRAAQFRCHAEPSGRTRGPVGTCYRKLNPSSKWPSLSPRLGHSFARPDPDSMRRRVIRPTRRSMRRSADLGQHGNVSTDARTVSRATAACAGRLQHRPVNPIVGDSGNPRLRPGHRTSTGPATRSTEICSPHSPIISGRSGPSRCCGRLAPHAH